MTDMGLLGTPFGSTPHAINERGQIVGVMETLDEGHAFLWEKGATRDLGTLGGLSVAFGINDRGQIVGYSENSSGEFHAVLWTK